MSIRKSSKRIIVGVGNAGVAVLDLLSTERPGIRDLLVVNSDQESLSASVVPGRITIPAGDPGEGFLAIEEEFGGIIGEAGTVLLCGGLGGEIGTFFLPSLAALSKAAGITTVAVVGMPFAFEGKRRREEAETSLAKLQGLCDAVAVIDNDRLSGGVPSTAAVGEAFREADRTLLASLLAIRGMLATTGPVRITRNDLAAVLGRTGALTHFGFGGAVGSNRLHEALERALKSPLLAIPGKGTALREAQTLLLLLSGPRDLSFAEVQLAVAEIERISGSGCQIKVGVHAEGEPTDALELYITTSTGGSAGAVSPIRAEAKAPGTQPSSDPRATPASAPVQEAAKPEVSPGPKSSRTKKKPAAKQTQGVLELDKYQRGRFDKSEPTIVGGEDLDVPTFLRKGIKIGPSQNNNEP